MCVHTQKGNEGINISGTPLCEKESSVVKGTHKNSYTNSITCRGLIFMVYYGGGFNNNSKIPIDLFNDYSQSSATNMNCSHL